MSRALPAAKEINELWRRCLDGTKVQPESCPSNEEVAEIIEKHFADTAKEEPKLED